ncbi:C1 family peptidase [Undibacterium fentianense]|uniref:C1 family peptidase n=1 Tax=Undibacterium fentianense TaxID=2828728 RepID=A0A941DYN0_9BURK|nr:C1 family peptidase [Undibacterium fentianense]MBR7799869.1 C1 family peptidase [Undibacterium fentianense]
MSVLFLLEADDPDPRDHPFVSPALVLPHSKNLRPHCPDVFDQGSRIGSCAANAVCNAYRFNLLKQARESGKATPRFCPSRLFLHYNARALAGKQLENKGAHLRDAIKSIAKHGLCPEAHWPYRAHRFAEQPPEYAYETAQRHQSIAYQRLPQDLKCLQACLADGYPFVLGITVFEAFDSAQLARRGVLSLPRQGEKKLGGHAVLIVGYSNRSERFLVMNSWGSRWGQQGYFSLPYAYVLDKKLAWDFWTLRTVED